MHLRDVVLFTTTLLAIVNPISSAVLFATRAGRVGGAIQRRMAHQCAFAALVVLLVCAWIGRPLLYCANVSDNSVSVIDTNTNAVTTTIKIPR